MEDKYMMQKRITNSKNKNSKLDKTYVDLLKTNGVKIINSKGNRGGWDITIQIDDLVDLELIEYLINFKLILDIGTIVIDDKI